MGRPVIHKVKYKGKQMSVAAACKKSGVDYATALQRINRGWKPLRSVTEPSLRPQKKGKRRAAKKKK